MESTSTIGRGTVVRGSVRGEGDLEIHGRVEGSVAVDGDLSIGDSALIKSDVSGRRVTVSGAVAGNVSATESIVLEAGARVVGDLGAPQIGIRPGALVRGMVSTHGALAPEAAPAASRAARPAAREASRPVAPAAARPAPVAARPAPRPAPPAKPAATTPRRMEARTEAQAAPRVEPVHEPPRPVEIEAEPAAHEEEAAEHGAHGGPPPPVVPQIRKGAKASLRKKAGR